MPADLPERILEDCRRAVGEVRFGFGSKRQVWAYEDRHQLDVVALAEGLAAASPDAFLDLAITFHDEFAAVSNAWRVRDRLEALTADLCRQGSPELLGQVAAAIVDDGLAVRHWLVAAFLAGPPLTALEGIEAALSRAYQPRDQWALLARLRALASEHRRLFGPETIRLLAGLAQLSARPEDRRQALELLALYGGPAAEPALARAAQGDADRTIRQQAAALLSTQASQFD